MNSSPNLNAKQTLREWLPGFLRQELAPYPGRWSLVSRMIIAATVSMIIIVTFRIPYGAVGANCAFILSRENLVSTTKSGFYFIMAYVAWAVLIPVGARLFASIGITHFLWEAVTIFICFYSLKAISYFPLAAGIVVVATSTVVVWYLPGPAELNVELTLWQILATIIGAVVTLLVEVVFRYFSKQDPVEDGIDDRLRNIGEMLRDYCEGLPIATGVAQSITQYAMTGTSMLRQQVARKHIAPVERAKTGAVIALLGRGIDISAAIVAGYSKIDTTQAGTRPHARADSFRAKNLMARLTCIRDAIRTDKIPARCGSVDLDPAPDGVPLLCELETVISLMESALGMNSSSPPRLDMQEDPHLESRLFVRDAFSNPDYLRFSLAGTAAAMVCYIIFVGLDWPGISTAVTTCILTALSNIGSSHQKQILRIGGASIGAFVFGLGSQMFVLPYIDSIVGLTILFAVVTGISAYVYTSSPRLSYAGLQMAFAFYLINVTDFTVSLDLTIGRDRAVGVLLGIAAMWLIFERLYPRPAAIQMVRMFAQSARLVASLKPVSVNEPEVKRFFTMRDQINSLFTNVNAEADAIPFENGEQRLAYLAARDRIRRWLSILRTLYLLELPLLQIGSNDGISPTVLRAQSSLLDELSGPLIHIATCLENQLSGQPCSTTNPAVASDTQRLEEEQHPSGMIRDEGLTQTSLQLLKMVRELEQDVMKEPVFTPSFSP
ncbi:FUSC family protein [Acidicapsa ligni]|uniref:FUSC family protein n=1 Tax=Acidicapsa ligni TaxID=542300 RepID=UPI0021E0AE94|nr:FUSC family protein [Acidicapsa ligni]